MAEWVRVLWDPVAAAIDGYPAVGHRSSSGWGFGQILVNPEICRAVDALENNTGDEVEVSKAGVAAALVVFARGCLGVGVPVVAEERAVRIKLLQLEGCGTEVRERVYSPSRISAMIGNPKGVYTPRTVKRLRL